MTVRDQGVRCNGCGGDLPIPDLWDAGDAFYEVPTIRCPACGLICQFPEGFWKVGTCGWRVTRKGLPDMIGGCGRRFYYVSSTWRAKARECCPECQDSRNADHQQAFRDREFGEGALKNRTKK